MSILGYRIRWYRDDPHADDALVHKTNELQRLCTRKGVIEVAYALHMRGLDSPETRAVTDELMAKYDR